MSVKCRKSTKDSCKTVGTQYTSSMEDADILTKIETEARNLVAQQLRSKAVVVARLLDLINQANHLGHTHESIHARTVAAGLDTSLKDYATYLYRARARARKGGSYEPKNTGSYDPKPSPTAPAGASFAPQLRPAFASDSISSVNQEDQSEESSSATVVVESLKRASKVGQRDYSSVVKASRRSGGK